MLPQVKGLYGAMLCPPRLLEWWNQALEEVVTSNDVA